MREFIFFDVSSYHWLLGFSRKMVNLLNGKGVAYSTFNILADQAVREGKPFLLNYCSMMSLL